MRLSFLICIAALFALSSCEEEETPIKPRKKRDQVTDSTGWPSFEYQLSLGDDTYGTQIYLDLSSEQVVQQHHEDEWDLAFSCTSGDLTVLLNSARLMQAAKTESEDLLDDFVVADYNFTYDHPSGYSDSLAIGEGWLGGGEKGHGKVYLVSLGNNRFGEELGVAKVKISSFKDGQYLVSYTDIKSGNIREAKIPVDPSKSFVYLSLANNEFLPDLEPAREDWDILFTTYTFFFYLEDGFFPYHVAGAWLNPHQTQGLRLKDKTFETFSSQDLLGLELSNLRDVIGYDWKIFDFDTQAYSMSKDVFLIQDSENNTYKMTFVDFYNESGQKGHPKLRIQRVQ